MLDHQLSQYKHGSKHCMMLAPVVTESKAKRSPALQHAVDSFVPRPGKARGPPVVAVLGIVGSVGLQPYLLSFREIHTKHLKLLFLDTLFLVDLN